MVNSIITLSWKNLNVFMHIYNFNCIFRHIKISFNCQKIQFLYFYIYTIIVLLNRKEGVLIDMEMRGLQKLIEDKKVELIKLVDKYGFRHQQVLSLSQDIDKLINQIIYINHKYK